MDKIIYFLIGLVIGLFVVFKPVERLSPPKDIINNHIKFYPYSNSVINSSYNIYIQDE